MQPQYQQQPQFPAAPQPYPNQQPPQAYPPQAYPPQAPPAYPPMPQYQQAPPQYAQPMPQPTAPTIPGTLDQFYSQPSTGGGKALTFEQPGTSYTGIVTRAVGNGDIQQQTDTQGRPSFFKDGRPKFVMKVPLMLQPSAAYPDGLAQWFIKGAARDELVRAMAEAGAPEGPPEAQAVITVTMTGTRPSGAGMNPTKLFAVQYRRPQGAPNAAPLVPVAEPAAYQIPPPAAAPQPVAPVGYQPAPPPIYATNGGGATTASNGVAAVTVAGPAVVPPPAPVAAAPAELSAEQQALLATLTGQVQPTH